MPATIPKPPLHPLSALAAVVIDGLASVVEIGVTATFVGVLLVPIIVVTSGLLSLTVIIGLERYWAHRAWKTALWSGVIMGLLTALPFFFLGGLAGLVVLGWAGIYELQKAPPHS